MHKWCCLASLACLFSLSACGDAQVAGDFVADRSPKGLYENPEDLPRLPYLRMEFAFEDSREATVEDGLEFVEATGTWGVYQVTSTNPRLYMPGINHQEVPYPEVARHSIAICSANKFFGAGFDGSERFNLRVYGVRSDGAPDQLLGQDTLHGQEFGNCSNPVDARTGDPDEVDIDRTYLAFGDPQPPVGTLITLRMVGINSPRDGTARVTHDNAWPVCCPSELECEVDAPPEPPDDSNPDGGAGEPPDVSNPPDGGSTEGPGDSTAPGEPPGISQPSVACALATGRRGGASATWLMLLLLGAALRRPRSVSGPA